MSKTQLLTQYLYALRFTILPCTDEVGCIAHVTCFIWSLHFVQKQCVFISCPGRPLWGVNLFILVVSVPGVSHWCRIGISVALELNGATDSHIWILFYTMVTDGCLPRAVWNMKYIFSILSTNSQWIYFLPSYISKRVDIHTAKGAVQLTFNNNLKRLRCYSPHSVSGSTCVAAFVLRLDSFNNIQLCPLTINSAPICWPFIGCGLWVASFHITFQGQFISLFNFRSWGHNLNFRLIWNIRFQCLFWLIYMDNTLRMLQTSGVQVFRNAFKIYIQF